MHAARRRYAALLACCLILALSGCAGESRDLLFYQDTTAYITLAEGDRTVRLTPQPQGVTLTYLAPSAICGFAVSFSGETAHASAAGACIPLSPSVQQALLPLASLLSLREDALTELRAEADGTRGAVFTAPAGRITVFFTKNGEPCRFALETADGERTLTVLERQDANTDTTDTPKESA